MVQGCLEWQKIGLREPAGIVKATQEYIDQQDFMEQFFKEQFPDGLEEVRASELYTQYETWAADTGHTRVNQTRFGKLLNQKGWETRKAHGVIMRVPPNTKKQLTLAIEPQGDSWGQLEPLGTVENVTHKTIPNQLPSVFDDSRGTVGDSLAESNPIRDDIFLFAELSEKLSPTVPQEKVEEEEKHMLGQFEARGTVGLKPSHSKKINLPESFTKSGLDTSGTVGGQLGDSSELEAATLFVKEMFQDQKQFQLVQICLMAGLGKNWPAVRLIQANDFTKEDWAVLAYRKSQERNFA
jgi:hypothetical protein